MAPRPLSSITASQSSTPSVSTSATARAPLRLHVHAPRRFEHSVMRRRLGLFAREPVGSQRGDRPRPSAGRTYSPVSFDTSTVSANISASRLVLKPRFCVSPRSGV